MATQTSTVIAFPYTGDFRMDVLISDPSSRWNDPYALRTPIVLNYSFMTAAPSWASGDDRNGFNTFTTAEKTATRQILSQISKVLNITFNEVTDAAMGSSAGLRFGNNKQVASAGYAYIPQSNGDGTFSLGSGDLYIGSNNITDPTFKVGSFDYGTLVHEIGHTLGLKHPGNYNAGSAASTAPDNFLSSALDSTLVSVMSYTDPPQGQQRDFYSTDDMLTLKYFYGGRAYNTGNDTYSYTDSDGSILKIINDSGGTDTIDLSRISTRAIVDLTPGGNSSFGKAPTGAVAQNNLQIAFDATIENIIGTPVADTLTGNDADNVIQGGGGNDTINGGKGTNTALYAGLRASFHLTKTSTGFTAADKTATEGTDTLTNIQKLQFSDMTINLLIGANAKTVTAAQLQNISELYIALFNRVPDADGLSYWIDQFKAGTSINSIADAFYGTAISTSFSALTGFTAGSANSTFITAVYKNVLGRSSVDAAGMTYWSNSLTDGSQTRGTLVNAILSAAHGYKGDATFGSVANLLDNKYAVGKAFAVDQGITYNSPSASYTKAQAIAQAVTATDTSAAVTLIGVSDTGFTLS